MCWYLQPPPTHTLPHLPTTGPDADLILRRLGHAHARTSASTSAPTPTPAPTLSSLFSAAPGACLLDARRCVRYRQLARQEVWHGGRQLATLLLQVTRPAAALRPAALAALSRELGGLVVTAAAPLPAAVTAGLLRAGARAVVCPDRPLVGPEVLGALGREQGREEGQGEGEGEGVGAMAAVGVPQLVAARESISFGGATPGVQELLARQGKHERTGGVGHTRDEGGVGAAAAVTAEAAAAFYGVLVREMTCRGASVVEAIAAAERSCPALRGRVALHHL